MVEGLGFAAAGGGAGGDAGGENEEDGKAPGVPGEALSAIVLDQVVKDLSKDKLNQGKGAKKNEEKERGGSKPVKRLHKLRGTENRRAHEGNRRLQLSKTKLYGPWES